MIPVVIVDDGEADRYLVKRRLSRSGDFQDLIEMPSGDCFLEEFFAQSSTLFIQEAPLLVLMDINMPGRDGFQTVDEAARRIADGQGPTSTVFLMYTSSLNAHDQERAKEIALVKGYLAKPMRKEGVDYIREIYRAHCAAS